MGHQWRSGGQYHSPYHAFANADADRSVLFASFVASGFIPMIHACLLDGIGVLGSFPLAHAIGMVTCYSTGVIFYLSRFPERQYPVKFDIWVCTTNIAYITLGVDR
jgi:adiponectin receptor